MGAFDTGLARGILCIFVLVLVYVEEIRLEWLKRFVNVIMAALVVIICGIFLMVMNNGGDLTADLAIWRFIEICMAFINIAFCYPIQLLLAKNPRNVANFFIVMAVTIATGCAVDFVYFKEVHSGINHVAFSFIFAYTIMQYKELKRITDGSFPKLQSLLAMEWMILIVNSLVIVLAIFGYRTHIGTINKSVFMLQLFKVYAVISAMNSFHAVIPT
eukprot:TRINITY_DN3656_c0_g1_i1.p1 TRINITY_DN3656_c0_g1~~TRINITY_DN3656_c0_g1_i1.p1  ORF type:complete len:216 (+),score=47.37 TRINITY_DN3656_c0_g1_i1:13-660(+)